MSGIINSVGAKTGVVGSPILDLEFIIVAGGGAGGTDRGGGGGAGGYIRDRISIPHGSYTVVVAASVSADTTSGPSNAGNNSSCFGYVAIGGGQGGTYSHGGGLEYGGSGGSGGGDSNNLFSSEAGLFRGGVSGQGNSGGGTDYSTSLTNSPCGGGGGAGGHGGHAKYTFGGTGGIGRSDDWTGSTRWLAGGGGGASLQGSGTPFKIAQSVCNACVINYAAAVIPFFFEDNHPFEVKMTLTFTETIIMTKEMVKEGY